MFQEITAVHVKMLQQESVLSIGHRPLGLHMPPPPPLSRCFPGMPLSPRLHAQPAQQRAFP